MDELRAVHDAECDRVRTIVERHPLTDAETDYLAEMLLECHGRSNISISPDEARQQLRIIVDWLESTRRIAPAERRDLLRASREG